MLFPVHEISCLQNVSSVSYAYGLGVLCNKLGELEADCSVLVVHLDSLSNCLVGDKNACNLLQLVPDLLELAGSEIYAAEDLSVLSVSNIYNWDVLNAVLPVSTHALKAVAGKRDHNCGKSLVSALDSKVQASVNDGAVECGEVLLGLSYLDLCAPHTEGDHASCICDLFRCVVRDNAYSLLALSKDLVQLLSGAGRYFFKSV